jgi:hypothetical protein
VTSSACEKLHLFADGELPAEEIPAFERHLIGCSSCQSELRDVMLLEALGSGLVEQARAVPDAERGRAADITPLHRPGKRTVRPRRSWSWPAGLAVAAVLLIVGALAEWRPSGGQLADLVQGDSRPFAERLAYPLADHHHELRVMRGGEGSTASPPLDVKALSRLEDAGDYQGLAAAYLLAGVNGQAKYYLDKSPHTPSVDVDRAVLAMHEQRWSDAAAALQSALAREPRHPQALWNLALLRQHQGDRAGAAAAFDEVARLGEPGWAPEAARRAAELRR